MIWDLSHSMNIVTLEVLSHVKNLQATIPAPATTDKRMSNMNGQYKSMPIENAIVKHRLEFEWFNMNQNEKKTD